MHRTKSQAQASVPCIIQAASLDQLAHTESTEKNRHSDGTKKKPRFSSGLLMCETIPGQNVLNITQHKLSV